MIPYSELEKVDLGPEGSTPERILDLYRQMEPVVQVIFMAYVRAAFIAKTVPHEVGYERARAMIERHRAGGEVTTADLESLCTP